MDSSKENIISIVGFLGAGKTTVLKHLVNSLVADDWQPFVILNDYENAYLDAQQFINELDVKSVKPLNGSCICCSGLQELRNFINRIPSREKGVTLIEANGTSDAVALSGFLGIGIEERFNPPVQISAVDARNWQKRGENNELEANQIQVSSLIILTHTNNVSQDRLEFVMRDVKRFNKLAQIVRFEELNIEVLNILKPSKNKAEKLEHQKAHWASCSIDLPVLPNREVIHKICDNFPKNILRVKGCALVGNDEDYTFFEKTPSGEANIRFFNGIPPMGAKLLTVGVGSDEELLKNALEKALESH